MNSFTLPEIVTKSLMDASPWVGEELMPEYDREDPYGQQGRPKNVVEFFWRLGYDLNNHDDFRRLADNFRWIERAREEAERDQARAEERRPRRFNAAMGIFAAVVGSALTAVISWFLSKH